MAYAFVKISSLSNVTATPAVPAFTGGNTAGNAIIVLGVAEQTAGSADPISGITDTQGNSYTAVVHLSASQAFADLYSIWIATSAIGGGGTNTLSISYTTGSRFQVYAVEYSGLATSSPFDATGNGTDSGGGTISYTVTAAAANELIATMLFRDAGAANWSALSGTDRISVTAQQFAIMDQVSSSGSNTISGMVSTGGINGLSAAFKLASAGGGSSVRWMNRQHRFVNKRG